MTEVVIDSDIVTLFEKEFYDRSTDISRAACNQNSQGYLLVLRRIIVVYTVSYAEATSKKPPASYT
jgi:hypothetical protein